MPQAVTRFSSRERGFDPKLAHMRYELDKVALELVFLRVHQFCLASVIPPVLHTNIHLLLLLLPEGQEGEAWVSSRQQRPFKIPGALDREVRRASRE